jgi:hypothetical protein
MIGIVRPAVFCGLQPMAQCDCDIPATLEVYLGAGDGAKAF